ncbi:hypothetical protein ACLOJK_010715 [Asimina triloba]
MGKRKSRAKPPPKKRMDKLDTVFSCPFCSHGTSVECRIDMKNSIGEATCRICQESFSTTINALSEPIDVYSEWIDECERLSFSLEYGAVVFCLDAYDISSSGRPSVKSLLMMVGKLRINYDSLLSIKDMLE